MKQKDNMYEWITKRKNFVGGRCTHACGYCFVPHLRFVQERYSGKLRLLKKEFDKPLGSGKVVFIQDCGDLFADAIPYAWIEKVLSYCREFDNTYLFQSKNPKRFIEFLGQYPAKTILGTTIESNKNYRISKAPSPHERFLQMIFLKETSLEPKHGFNIMVSIEPIMDFDLGTFVHWIKTIKPSFVSIGADSKKHHLPEPPWEKVEILIKELKKFTEVRIKSNLERLKKR